MFFMSLLQMLLIWYWRRSLHQFNQRHCPGNRGHRRVYHRQGQDADQGEIWGTILSSKTRVSSGKEGTLLQRQTVHSPGGHTLMSLRTYTQ